jgi:hypothetical protein
MKGKESVIVGLKICFKYGNSSGTPQAMMQFSRKRDIVTVRIVHGPIFGLLYGGVRLVSEQRGKERLMQDA